MTEVGIPAERHQGPPGRDQRVLRSYWEMELSQLHFYFIFFYLKVWKHFPFKKESSFGLSLEPWIKPSSGEMRQDLST